MKPQVSVGESGDFGDTTIVAHEVFLRPGGAVLLVDDDPLALEVLQLQVAAAGYIVFTADSGEAALTALATNFCPVVIVDRNMPQMDGLALCREIRGRPWPGYVYTMLLTAQDAEKDILEGLEAGADDYLSKKASTAQLLARLRTARRILSLEQSLRTMAEERKRMAMTDPLTGAASRRYLMRQLGRELSRAVRHTEDLAAMIIDVDHFKRINDTCGHAAGDDVLVELVRRIQAALPRDCDWCARYGGEEFVAVLPRTAADGAAVVAARIRSAVTDKPFQAGTQALRVTVSIGVATLSLLPDGARQEAEPLLSLADQCLYHSKRTGRDRVTVAPPGGTGQ